MSSATAQTCGRCKGTLTLVFDFIKRTTHWRCYGCGWFQP